MKTTEMMSRSYEVLSALEKAMRELNDFGDYLALNHGDLPPKSEAFRLVRKAYDIVEKAYYLPAYNALRSGKEDV